MSIIFRDITTSVIVIDEDIIRATYGLQEFLARPTVILKACYAVPKHHGRHEARSRQTTEAPQADGEAISSGSKNGWVTGNELQKTEGEGDFEENWDLRWPFRDTKAVDDWEGREFILSHIIDKLGIKTQTNPSPLLLIPPITSSGLSLQSQALYTQIAFESLNTPGFAILPSPLPSLFALNATTGIVLNIGRFTSTVNIVVDSIVRWECSTTIPVGIKDCEDQLIGLLTADNELDTQLRGAVEAIGEQWDGSKKEKMINEVADFIWRECIGDDVEIPPMGGKKIINQVGQEVEDESFDVAKKLVGDAPVQQPASHKIKTLKGAAATASANKAASDASKTSTSALPDVIAVNIPSIPDKEFYLGPNRHRLAEPLFKGREVGGDTIWEGVGRALDNEGLSVSERIAVWDAVAVTGEMARFKSFAPALVTYLAPLLLSSSELPSDTQPSKARLLSIPDYFTNFKGCTNELAPFLGASMVGKVIFNESAGKHFITKVDYNAKGPAAIYTMTNTQDS